MLPVTGTGPSAGAEVRGAGETKLLPKAAAPQGGVFPLPLRGGSKGSHSFRATPPGGATLRGPESSTGLARAAGWRGQGVEGGGEVASVTAPPREEVPPVGAAERG